MRRTLVRTAKDGASPSQSHLDQNVKDFFPRLWGEVVEVGKDSTHVFCNSNSYQDPQRLIFTSELNLERPLKGILSD